MIVPSGSKDLDEVACGCAGCVALRHRQKEGAPSTCMGLWGSTVIIPGMGFDSLWGTMRLVRMGKWNEPSVPTGPVTGQKVGGGDM